MLENRSVIACQVGGNLLRVLWVTVLTGSTINQYWMNELVSFCCPFSLREHKFNFKAIHQKDTAILLHSGSIFVSSVTCICCLLLSDIPAKGLK